MVDTWAAPRQVVLARVRRDRTATATPNLR